MRRLLYLFFLFCALNVSAQNKSIIIDLGYRTKFEETKWGVGGQFKYQLFNNFRLATDLTYYFIEKNNLGLDIGVTAQYLLPLHDKLSIYPIAGVIISNHSFDAIPNSYKYTDLGLSIGGGSEFNIAKNKFINAEFKYYFLNKEKQEYRDYGIIKIGYGFRF